MRSTFIMLTLALVVSLGLIEPAVSQVGGVPNVECRCVGTAANRIYYNDCVSLLSFTTAISDGQCGTGTCTETPCEWFFHIFAEVKEECGGEDIVMTQDAPMACGSVVIKTVTLEQSAIAQVLFVCHECDAGAVPAQP